MKKWQAIAIILFIAITFLLFRIILPWHEVFTSEGTQLNTVDAYWQVRLADIYDNLSGIDYFSSFPDGEAVSKQPFAGIIYNFAHLLGTDNATAGALLPPIFFAMTLLIVYEIARKLFQRKEIALISTAVLAIMPGELMHRTILGAADYHCFEIMFMAFIILVILEIIQSKSIKGVLPHAIILIILAPAYLATMRSSALAMLPILVLFSFALGTIAFYKKPLWWLLCLSFIVPSTILLGNWIIPLTSQITSQLDTVNEMQPLLFTNGKFDMSIIIMHFGLAFYIMLFGLGTVIQKFMRTKSPALLLLIVWTGIILIATLLMRRFSYYLGINIAIITGFFIWHLIALLKTSKANLRKALVVLIAIAILPLIYNSSTLAWNNTGTMSKDWRATTSWLETRAYPTSYTHGDKLSLGVLSDWSYGYWIIQASKTPAYGTPGNQREPNILLETDREKAEKWLAENQIGYIIITEDMFKKTTFKNKITENSLIWQLRHNTEAEFSTDTVKIYNLTSR